LASDLWPVLVDVSQIETALLNVALNARDAMPGGGVLVIETANIRARNKELPAEVVGQDCVLVSLRDTGTGMSPEVIERAFEPFFTTKEMGKGTGLGLSMVFGVVASRGAQSAFAAASAKELPFRSICREQSRSRHRVRAGPSSLRPPRKPTFLS
jgi:signal transduction histidine kinase